MTLCKMHRQLSKCKSSTPDRQMRRVNCDSPIDQLIAQTAWTFLFLSRLSLLARYEIETPTSDWHFANKDSNERHMKYEGVAPLTPILPSWSIHLVGPEHRKL